MATPTPAKSPAPSNPKNNLASDEAAKAQGDTGALDPTKAESSASAPRPEPSKAESKVIISLSVTPRVARAIRTTARLENASISDLVVSIVEREINGRLKAALAALKDDIE